MNFIFLDVDGVLNDFATMLFTDEELCDEKLEMIGSLCEDQHCQIVLSTSWRHGMNENTLECEPGSSAEKLTKALKSKGCVIAGRTGEYASDRGLLIADYVKAHLKEDDKFLILDDEDIVNCSFTCNTFPGLESHFLRTNALVGMTYEDYKKAVLFFEGDPNWKDFKVQWL